jgi:hypothetical protein
MYQPSQSCCYVFNTFRNSSCQRFKIAILLAVSTAVSSLSAAPQPAVETYIGPQRYW